MAKRDSHYAIYFTEDKSLVLVTLKRIIEKNGFKSVIINDKEELEVYVNFKTRDIDESGELLVQNRPYHGFILMSGGMLYKCIFIKCAI